MKQATITRAAKRLKKELEKLGKNEAKRTIKEADYGTPAWVRISKLLNPICDELKIHAIYRKNLMREVIINLRESLKNETVENGAEEKKFKITEAMEREAWQAETRHSKRMTPEKDLPKYPEFNKFR